MKGLNIDTLVFLVLTEKLSDFKTSMLMLIHFNNLHLFLYEQGQTTKMAQVVSVLAPLLYKIENLKIKNGSGRRYRAFA